MRRPVSLVAPGAMQSFTLTFWSGVSGPGAAIASYAVAGDAGETFVGLGSDGNAYYAYSSGLATPFEAWAGTTYWLSVVANMDYLDPLGNSREWGWAFATGGDGHWYQDFFGTRYHDGDSVGDPSTDLAFTLSTPEPGAYSLILAGLSALAALRRRAGRRRY